MRLVDVQSGMEIVEAAECHRLLATKEVGRLGFLSGRSPEILPVNYVLDGDAIVFATAAGAKLWGTTCSEVVFEVDDTDPTTHSGWSVIVHGVAREVTGFDAPGLVTRIRALPVSPWVEGERSHLVRIAPRRVSGRRIGVSG